MKRRGHTSRVGRAFTLVELLLVITIIGILAAVAVPRFFGRSQDAKIAAAKQTIVGTFGTALDLYEQDVGQYPTADQGLNALITDPGVKNWRGPYLKSSAIPSDPWGSPYTYTYPSQITGSQVFYDIVSGGPDGVSGGNDDITNHNAQETSDNSTK